MVVVGAGRADKGASPCTQLQGHCATVLQIYSWPSAASWKPSRAVLRGFRRDGVDLLPGRGEIDRNATYVQHHGAPKLRTPERRSGARPCSVASALQQA